MKVWMVEVGGPFRVPACLLSACALGARYRPFSIIKAPRRIMNTVDDRNTRDMGYMAEALALARGVPGRTWPNPPVGAVVVHQGRIVGRGAHQGPGSPHAEPMALAEAGDLARAATLYVTLEPCNHQGRTEPCAPTVASSGVSRLVVAMRDPNPTVTGGGCRFLRDRGLEVTIGVRADEALELVWPFVASDNFTRPYLELKTAQSLDGFFAPGRQARSDTAPVYLTGQAALADVHARRRRVDLVLVGEGTVKADRPCLDGRRATGRLDVPEVEPLAGYLDRDLSWQGGFARNEYLVFAGQSARDAARERAIESDGGRVVYCLETGGRLDPGGVLTAVGEQGLHAVMLEGGPRCARAYLEAGLVDRWVRYLAPVLLGEGVGWPAPNGAVAQVSPFTLTRCQRLGEDLLGIHDRRGFADVLARVTL